MFQSDATAEIFTRYKMDAAVWAKSQRKTFPFNISLSNVVLRHELKDKVDPVSEAYPHLILDNFGTKLGDRISDVLKHLFPMPKIDTKRVMTFVNKDDYISFRHHVYRKTDHKNVETKELGPRFEMKPY